MGIFFVIPQSCFSRVEASHLWSPCEGFGGILVKSLLTGSTQQARVQWHPQLAQCVSKYAGGVLLDQTTVQIWSGSDTSM